MQKNSQIRRININTATIDELKQIHGIGQKTAENIVNFRERYGAFRKIEHLMLVDKISEKQFLEIEDTLTTE